MSGYWFCLYNWTLWNIAFFIAYKKTLIYKRCGINGYLTSHKDHSSYLFLYLIFVFYMLFTYVDGDRQGYEMMVVEAGRYGFNTFINMESVYVWFAWIVNGNYYLWKIIVYGGAILLLHLSLKRLKVDNLISLCFFAGLALYAYGLTRGILAFAIYVYGLTFIKDKKAIKIALGWFFVVISFFFHNQMIPLIMMTPLVYMKLTKRRVLYLIMIYPLVQLVFNFVISSLGDLISFLGTDYGQEHLQFKYQGYFEETDSEDRGRHSLLYYVQLVFELMCFIPILVYSLKQNYKNKIEGKFSTYVSAIFFISYFTLLLLFCPLPNANFMFRRYLNTFPFVAFILAVPMFNAEIRNYKYIKNITVMMLIKNNFVFAYLMYNEYIRSTINWVRQ